MGENRGDEIWVGEEEEQETSADIGGDVNCQERKRAKGRRPADGEEERRLGIRTHVMMMDGWTDECGRG